MKIFIEPDTLRNMLADRYFCNVLDAGRAGGLFVNAQEGAQFAGFNLLIVGWLWSKQRSNIFPLIGVLWLCALIAFGTMTGVIACALTMLCGLVLLTVKRKWSVIPSLIVVMFIIAGVVLMPWLQPRLAKYRTFDSSVNGRSRIWHASALVIGDHWVKGVGLDSNSWERAYAPHAEKVGAILKVPPHNVFLFVWAKAGILAFLCFVGFFISAICRYSLDFLRSGDTYALLVAMAFIWFGAECMTENFLIMDLRLAGALWMIMGLRVK